jgi:hypothetical protein
MTSETVPTPSESDVSAVEQRLAALYDELPASQQIVLDAILGAGLAVLSTASDDTSGYIDPALTNPAMLEAELRYRIGEIQKAARDIKVNREGGTPAPRRRWNLRPVLDWFHRAPAPASGPQPRLRPGTGA